MTTPDEKERVEIGEHNSRQATVRHLWGQVYGVSRPGEEEFRITADEVEDLAEYIEDQPLTQQAERASFTVRRCGGCDDKRLTLPTADGRDLCSECMKNVPREKRPRCAKRL